METVKAIAKTCKTGEDVLFIIDAPANYGNLLSYMIVGQHGEASLEFYHDCKPCKSPKKIVKHYENLYNCKVKLYNRLVYSTLCKIWGN